MSHYLFKNISEALTLNGCVKKNGAHLTTDDLGIIKNAAIITDDKSILWVGQESLLPSEYMSNVKTEINCNNCVATPALIDSHTHLLFSGDRSNEYFMRLSGLSYEEIAKLGGGITYTSSITNNLTEEELYTIGLDRLKHFYNHGVYVVEIKSGYCLTLDGEYKMMKVIDKLAKKNPYNIQIHRTLMAAHAIPKNISKDKYINTVVLPLIEKCASEKLVDSVDIFHELNYFSTSDVELIFKWALGHNLSVKLHADELNNNEGASLASKYKCLSADHLLETDSEGASDLAKNNIVATLLPGTALFLGKKIPNAKNFTALGCRVAIASDFNPGSCHQNDVFLIARTCAPSLKINPAEFWCAITFNAAKALNISTIGALVPYFSNKFLIWDESKSEKLLYDWSVRQKCRFSF